MPGMGVGRGCLSGPRGEVGQGEEVHRDRSGENLPSAIFVLAMIRADELLLSHKVAPIPTTNVLLVARMRCLKCSTTETKSLGEQTSST